jgi:parallel beta-helix repeat protein
MTRALPLIAALATCAVSSSIALGQEPGTGIACGDTITADVTLDRDLTDCGSNGIVIGADGITLDLNGHTISGDGEPVRRCRRDQICDVGVANDDHAGVTIRGGSVRGFGIGVGVFRGRNNRFVKLDSSRNQFFGFVIAGSSRTVIRDSTGHDNPRPDGDGLGVFMSHDLRIVHNSFRRNGQLGMHIVGSRKNLVKGNLVSRNGDFGMLLEADGNQVRGNRSVRDGGTGILVGPGSRNVIAGNRISGSGEGIAVEKGRGNRVVRNVVAHTRKSGIRLGIGDPPIGGTGTLVRGNLVLSAGGDGFLVAKSDRSALLQGNTARRSGDDGFDINSRSARLIGNRALGSADLGIEFP